MTKPDTLNPLEFCKIKLETYQKAAQGVFKLLYSEEHRIETGEWIGGSEVSVDPETTFEDIMHKQGDFGRRWREIGVEQTVWILSPDEVAAKIGEFELRLAELTQ